MTDRAKEIEQWRDFARRLSTALLKIRPLGGSEMVVKFGDDYFADPEYCGSLIEAMRSDLHNARLAEARALKRDTEWQRTQKSSGPITPSIRGSDAQR